MATDYAASTLEGDRLLPLARQAAEIAGANFDDCLSVTITPTLCTVVEQVTRRQTRSHTFPLVEHRCKRPARWRYLLRRPIRLHCVPSCPRDEHR